MAKQNNTNTNESKVMTVKEIMGMTVTSNEKTVSLVKFVPNNDDLFVDTSVNVSNDYAFPKKAYTDDNGNTVFHPVYYACALKVDFARDVKNVTTGDKEERKQKNAKIMEEATGFKAVCRDLTAMAGKSDKGFLKMTASMPCDEKVNVNKSISCLWLFTSKNLRENWLKAVRNGVNSGKYKLANATEKGKKRSKRIEAIAKAFGITYEEAFAKMHADD